VREDGQDSASTPTATPPAGDTIAVEGELVSRSPPLQVSFPAGVSGRLSAIYVELGQRVAAGDRLAAVEDADLQRALYAAQRNLVEAQALLAAGEQEAGQAYQRARAEAQADLNRARQALRVAAMQPPTTAVVRAETALERAQEAEAQAADAYKQALDRPWEPQLVRDGLHKEWQHRIAERELAELDLEDAQAAVQAHALNLAALRADVTSAEAGLEGLSSRVDPALSWRVSKASQELAEARERSALTELYAPQDGLVVSLDAALGASVGGSTPIVTLVDTEALSFRTLRLEERAAAALRPGQPAQIRLRFYPDAAVAGEVELLLPEVDDRSEERFVATLRLTDRAGLELWPGMTGRAEISMADE
jgi:multidrug resistance efflux pump